MNAGDELKKYRVEVNGQNFLIDVDGCVAKHGFFTVRFVEAPDPSAAENAALEMIRLAKSLRDLVRNGPADPPMMYGTSIEERESFEDIENLEPGFIWYPEEPE